METKIIRNKWDSDFSKGKSEREKAIAVLNNALSEQYQLIRIHSFLKTMTGSEKKKNNIVKHRNWKASFEQAMGLDYQLQKKQEEINIPIKLFTYDAIYIKLPSDYTVDWLAYLNLCSFLNYHFIICDVSTKQFSLPVHINVFLDRWTPYKANSDGNRNRVSFKGPVSKIARFPLNFQTIQGDNVIKNLENLIP